MGERGKLLVKLALQKLAENRSQSSTFTDPPTNLPPPTPSNTRCPALDLGQYIFDDEQFILIEVPPIPQSMSFDLTENSTSDVCKVSQTGSSSTIIPTTDCEGNTLATSTKPDAKQSSLDNATFIYDNDNMSVDLENIQPSPSPIIEKPLTSKLIDFNLIDNSTNDAGENSKSITDSSYELQDTDSEDTSTSTSFMDQPYTSMESRPNIDSVSEVEPMSDQLEINDTSDDCIANKSSKRKREMKNRMLGKKYLGYRKISNETGKVSQIQDVVKQDRQMGPRCTIQSCKKFTKFSEHCGAISEEDRSKMFCSFWKLNWNEKKNYISNLVLENQTQRATTVDPISSRRNFSLKYRINLKDRHVEV